VSARNPEIIEQRNNAWASRSLAKVIRAFCCECMGGQRSQIDGCTAIDCALYPFRGGQGTRSCFDAAMGMLSESGYKEAAEKAAKTKEDNCLRAMAMRGAE
jgi:hypothetical protein